MAFESKIVPYLSVKGAARALDFYTAAFGAVESIRLPTPDGRLGHAELTIGGALLMLADEFPEMAFVSPKTVGGTSVTLSLEVEDADATVNRAVAAGAKVVRPVADQFYGRRSGQVLDPFGHRWDISAVTEQLTNEEIAERSAKLYGGKESQ
jgi:PhnB protein